METPEAPHDVRATLLAGNARFVKDLWRSDEAQLSASPDLALAVVGCMDARYSIQRVLGLEHGHAKVLRNAGPVLDDGVRRSLAIAIHLLDVKHVAVLGHTDCGVGAIGRGELAMPAALVQAHGSDQQGVQAWLGAFTDPEENVRVLCGQIRDDEIVPASVDVFGLIYDNATGRILPVG